MYVCVRVCAGICAYLGVCVREKREGGKELWGLDSKTEEGSTWSKVYAPVALYAHPAQCAHTISITMIRLGAM